MLGFVCRVTIPVVTNKCLCVPSQRQFSRYSRRQLREVLMNEVYQFQTDLPVEKASTPPSSWYTEPTFHHLEINTIFSNNWIPVGRLDQVANPGSYFTGSIGHSPFVITRDNGGVLRAFHNVCRHRGMLLCSDDAGHNMAHFKCPYHGWTYDLTGRLTKAIHLRGIQDFSAKRFGLKPIRVMQWGPLVFICNTDTSVENACRDDLDTVTGRLNEFRFGGNWKHVRRVLYSLKCNWKLVCDNILDNGYHVTTTHPKYSKLLDISSFKTEILGKSSLCLGQSTNADDRVQGDIVLAHIYPNLVINRYGDWLETNIILPRAYDKCDVIYDYFLTEDFINSFTSANKLDAYVNRCINASEELQKEDNFVCEGAQMGLNSSSYTNGRYSPGEENPNFIFHKNIATEFRDYFEE